MTLWCRMRLNASQNTPIYAYMHMYKSTKAQKTCQQLYYNAYIYIYVFNLYMHSNACIYGWIWPYILIFAAFRCLRGVQDLFTAHSHLKSWCALHQADTAMVQCYQTSMQRAVVPAQLPLYMVIQLNILPYKWLTKPNLSICNGSITGKNILLSSSFTSRPLSKGARRYKR